MHGAIGGIAASDNSNVTVLDSIFVNNTAGTAGAISMTGGSLAVYNTTFMGNSGTNVRPCSPYAADYMHTICSHSHQVMLYSSGFLWMTARLQAPWHLLPICCLQPLARLQSMQSS